MERYADVSKDTTAKHSRRPHRSSLRAAFLDMMIDHLPPGCANFNKRLIKYAVADRSSHRQSAAPIQLFFEDGSTYEADLLLAADGIKSAIRPQMLADMMPPEQLKPQFTNTVGRRWSNVWRTWSRRSLTTSTTNR